MTPAQTWLIESSGIPFGLMGDDALPGWKQMGWVCSMV